MNNKPKLTLILGSGFSAEAGVPTAKKIPSNFLSRPLNSPIPEVLDDTITKVLKYFWETVFGYSRKGYEPTLEDHFTVLDIAANSGHNLGTKLSPKKLRSIRRMSIHRTFQILNSPQYREYNHSNAIPILIDTLRKEFEISIVTLNWDVVLESHLYGKKLRYNYQLDMYDISATPGSPIGKKIDDIIILKLHGSSNWVYCNNCRRLFTHPPNFHPFKTALLINAYLEKSDFKEFTDEWKLELSDDDLRHLDQNRDCPNCGGQVAGRLATFSFRKDLSLGFFQTIWDIAHRILQEADIWLFIGYSLPEADFEFRHLLKSAQFARGFSLGRNKTEAILFKDKTAGKRFKTFFGPDNVVVSQDGLSGWVNSQIDHFISRITT